MSAEYFSIIGTGSMAFPRLLDIFLPFESSACPEIIMSFHGSFFPWKCAFTTVLKAHRVMMSCACGLRDIGNIFACSFESSAHREFICGVSEDVIHVSRTSFSGTNSPEPHLGHFFAGCLSSSGSTGRSLMSAGIISSHFLQYHMGNGTPKNLCLEMLQSHCNPLIQFS